MPRSRIPSSVSAWLPDGTRFIPGATYRQIGAASCTGPDARGACPSLQAGQVPACHAALWVLHADDGRSWPFRFRAPLRACPVTLLTGTPPVVDAAS